MKKLFALLVPVVAALSSCTTVSKTAKTADISASIRNVSVADLDVSPERVTYILTPSKAVRRGGTDNIKRVAESEALAQNGGDVLVNPEFTVTKRRGLFGSKVTSVTVTGRLASYTNVRSLPDSVWCNPVFMGVPQRSTAHSRKASGQAKAGKSAPAFAEPVRKWTHMVRLGLGSNTFNMDADEGIESRFGFSLGYEANRAIGRKGAYYGFDVTFATRGYHMGVPDDAASYEADKFDQFVPGIHVTPLIFGWKVNVGKNVALDPHFGIYLGGDFTDDATLYDSAFDAGWKLGLGVWFKKKFAIDFTYQGGFVYNEGEYTTENGYYSNWVCMGSTGNSMFRLTYAF